MNTSMTPEYLEELADAADPDKLWRRGCLDRADFTAKQRQQLDTGVALRRHANHVRRLRALQDTGKSLLLTPLSLSGTDIRTVPTPSDIQKRLLQEMPKAPANSATSSVVTSGPT